jgi:phosphatidylserine/phosphatidylglycerophosphate/cardiolipin synthase-like enzyme
MVAGAVNSVCLTMYIFSDDESGRSVLSELVHAALRGVRVRIIIDGFGLPSLPTGFLRSFAKQAGSSRDSIHIGIPGICSGITKSSSLPMA